MMRIHPLSRARSALLLGAALPLLAGAEPPASSPPERNWLATPPPPADSEPSFRDPQLELFPGVENVGVPDQHGISPGLREEIRRHSERVLNQVSDELSTQ